MPTAQISLAEMAVTAERRRVSPLFGGALGTTLHFVPFQCRISADPLLPAVPPTAQTLLGARAVIPERGDVPGLETTLQAVPFQCSIRLVSSTWFGPRPPTAQISLAETAATLVSASDVAGFGLAIIVQEIPFHRSI